MGHNSKDLKDALKYRGWDKKTVDRVFREAKIKPQNESVPPPEQSNTPEQSNEA